MWPFFCIEIRFKFTIKTVGDSLIVGHLVVGERDSCSCRTFLANYFFGQVGILALKAS